MGAKISIFDLDEKKGIQVETELKENGVNCLFFHCDVTLKSECEEAVKRTKKKFGKIYQAIRAMKPAIWAELEVGEKAVIKAQKEKPQKY